ncbi:peptidase [Streptomyces griseocarneus]|nr:peptidase [Streptomyces griseocarneus]
MTAHMPMTETEARSVPRAATGSGYTSVPPVAAAPEPAADGWDAWSPATPAASAAPVARGGRHRVAKPRGGTMARSGAVLGVGIMASVGAGGMASAQDRPAAPISVPDLPVVNAIFGGDAAKDAGRAEAAPVAPAAAEQPLAQADLIGTANAGEALRARILQQAEHQQNAAEDEARAETQRKATAEAARKAAEAAAAAAASAAQETRKAATEEKADDPDEVAFPSNTGNTNTAKHPRSPERSTGETSRTLGAYALPVGSYTLTAGFGQAGNMWSANHTGTDFAAPTGTPVRAVGSGTITHAGWAGAYGYRIVLKLDDGTEVWFCHLSSMVVTSGRVSAGDVIGRVGATGNVTGPHLHLEVRPGGGAPVDPLPWLRDRGLTP